MGNSCTAPSCGKKLRNCCARYVCCDCCPCNCCSEPKFGRDNNVVTSSPISMGLVVAPTDDTTDHCKYLFWRSMSNTHKIHTFFIQTIVTVPTNHIAFFLFTLFKWVILLFNFYDLKNPIYNIHIYLVHTWVGGQWSLRINHVNHNKIKVTLIALLHWNCIQVTEQF